MLIFCVFIMDNMRDVIFALWDEIQFLIVSLDKLRFVVVTVFCQDSIQ